MAARAARRLPHRRSRHLFPTTVQLALPIGRQVGLRRRRLGAASMEARAARSQLLRLSPTTALPASPIGRQAGPFPRRLGAASTEARAAHLRLTDAEAPLLLLTTALQVS